MFLKHKIDDKIEKIINTNKTYNTKVFFLLYMIK